MPFVVGTAGHIDHGKTALVRALTGQDTDRLPEERARGIVLACRTEACNGAVIRRIDTDEDLPIR